MNQPNSFHFCIQSHLSTLVALKAICINIHPKVVYQFVIIGHVMDGVLNFMVVDSSFDLPLSPSIFWFCCSTCAYSYGRSCIVLILFTKYPKHWNEFLQPCFLLLMPTARHCLILQFDYVICISVIFTHLFVCKQVTSGDYILWNTLGKCPSAAAEKVQLKDGNSEM